MHLQWFNKAPVSGHLPTYFSNCPEEILIELTIVLMISKSSWNTACSCITYSYFFLYKVQISLMMKYFYQSLKLFIYLIGQNFCMELDPGEYFHNMLPMLAVVSQYMPLFLAFNRSNYVKLNKFWLQDSGGWMTNLLAHLAKVNMTINYHLVSVIHRLHCVFRVGLWCLTPLLTIFQLYCGGLLLVEETVVPGENHWPGKLLTKLIT
jgi:hypothetical protein